MTFKNRQSKQQAKQQIVQQQLKQKGTDEQQQVPVQNKLSSVLKSRADALSNIFNALDKSTKGGAFGLDDAFNLKSDINLLLEMLKQFVRMETEQKNHALDLPKENTTLPDAVTRLYNGLNVANKSGVFTMPEICSLNNDVDLLRQMVLQIYGGVQKQQPVAQSLPQAEKEKSEQKSVAFTTTQDNNEDEDVDNEYDELPQPDEKEENTDSDKVEQMKQIQDTLAKKQQECEQLQRQVQKLKF